MGVWRLCLLLVASGAHVLLAQQAGPRCPSSDDGYDADVLILGAGMAGISAARVLHESGVNFTVLEARDRVGGRMRSEEFGGIRVEVGANWIHDVNPANPRDHPIWSLAMRCGLKGNFSNTSNSVLYDGSTTVPEANSRMVAERFGNAIRAIGMLDEPAISVREALNRVGWSLNSRLSSFIEWFGFDFQFSDMPRNISLREVEVDDSNSQSNVMDFFVADQRGYEYLVHCLGSEFNFSTNPMNPDSRLFLNTTVTRINWSDQCVCVDTNAGRVFCGKRAIVTFGIGVLQSASSMMSFNPPLPQSKIDAINALSMPLYLKIFVKFNSSFWDDEEYIGRLTTVKGEYQMFQPLCNINGKFLEIPRNCNTLLVTLTEPMSRRVSGQPIEETRNQIVQHLREIYPSAGVPEPVDILVPTWAQDPLYRGAYSNVPPGPPVQAHERLAAPVGRLYFSGEATNSDSYGTVHGAFLAGVETARMIAPGGQATVTSSLFILLSISFVSLACV